MPPRQPDSTDVSALDVDLGKLLDAQVKGTESVSTLPTPALDIQGQLKQLQDTLLTMSRMGAIERRVDGSFMVPGNEDPRQRQIDLYGSECHCRNCTSHNQQHWVCAVCFGVFEWSSGQGPKDEFYTMGEAGRGGKRYSACSNQCALMLRQKKAQVFPPLQLPPDHIDVSAIPVAGGDEGYSGLVG